jgi:hypothetical protein
LPVIANVPPPFRLPLSVLRMNVPEPCFALTDPCKLRITAGDGSQRADAYNFFPEVRYVPLRPPLPVLDQLPEGVKRTQKEEGPLPTTVVNVAR